MYLCKLNHVIEKDLWNGHEELRSNISPMWFSNVEVVYGVKFTKKTREFFVIHGIGSRNS